ncbi:MAG: hypothetical protein KZQ93_08845 [Candidatus Thiodiazotropha sp. (ex Monitilora ramsayi)]|nr:hypothetical protein [Candidatus Thiodiazotropha sp. (ex Monitilora ramsayi)]
MLPRLGLIVSIRIRPIVCLLGVLVLNVQAVLAEEATQEGPYTDTECVSCHTERDPELIRQWRASAHGPESGVECSSCHGDFHQGSAVKARRNDTCSGCHEGPASHSYTTSKHGVISRLESVKQDWQKRLKAGNYRAPGCGYCHFHDGDHGDTMAPGRGPEMRQWVCSGCHSPRYVREQFANGYRQMEIADLKLIEGEALIAASDHGQTDSLTKLRLSLIRHHKNVLYGVGHQSPDYQWWHGQPALDGDLIRIRDAIGERLRQKRFSEQLLTDTEILQSSKD